MSILGSNSEDGSTIINEVHVGLTLLASVDDVYKQLQDVENMYVWASELVSCVLPDNNKKSYEIGVRRRVVTKKAPYHDLMIRETLTEKYNSGSSPGVGMLSARPPYPCYPINGHPFAPLDISSTSNGLINGDKVCVDDFSTYGGKSATSASKRARIVFEYSPISAETSFSSLGLDGKKKAHIASQQKFLVDPEPVSVSETRSYSRVPPNPTILNMKTTYTLGAITEYSESSCYLEILCEYALHCGDPGLHQERLRYDELVLREFLEKYWISGIASQLSKYLRSIAYPINGMAAFALPCAKEHAFFENVASEMSVKAKDEKDNKNVNSYLELLSSWECLVLQIQEKEEIIQRMSHEINSSRHITTAATQLSSVTSQAEAIMHPESVSSGNNEPSV
eukprot:Tbor_TRINITY_DN6252_c0_g1::TRINITY_DN6252_c0_g1_i1::g.2196::m.2196